MDKEHILSEIKRTTEENDGRPLGKGRFQKETGIKPWDWCGKYWTGWSEAIAEAGYTNPNKLQSAYSDEFLLGKLVELIQELDCFPTSTELRLKGYQDKQFPTHNTFSRFGRKAGLIEAVLNYLNIKLRQIRRKHFQKYLEGYARALTSRDAEKYVDGEDEVIDFETLINEVALLRNKYLGIMKGLDTKQWQLGHIVRLRTAGMEDVQV